jgi:hypothetical protein
MHVEIGVIHNRMHTVKLLSLFCKNKNMLVRSPCSLCARVRVKYITLPVIRQWLDRHVLAAMNTHATIEEFLDS